MLEPPSDELQQRLRDWQLCRPGDLRRARRIVQRLARDLPAFDSVWIDALVQLRCLTPYQARILESETPASLRIGNVLLLDEIGRSACGRTWLGRSLDRNQLCVVKRVRAPQERQAGVSELGRRLVSTTVGFEHPHLVAATSCFEDQDGCVFVSPFVDGVPLSELLVRRGRFPPAIVAEIARQLAKGLRSWHSLGQVHGDIRLTHVRINSLGHAVLVEAGLRAVIEPEITLHVSLSPEAYDGVAPELIGIGREPTPAADFYALGCLLWQLLAGRPPYSTADPLAKLAAHQTRTIDDVREWAPDTPAALAELVSQLTRRAPSERPASADEILRHLARMSLPGAGAVRRFRRQFDLAVPHLRQPLRTTALKWPAALTAAALMVASLVLLADRDRRNELLSISAGWWSDAARKAEHLPTITVDATSGLLPLPAPEADGTLLLTEAGPYSVAAVRYTGRLQIRGVAGVCPEILIRDQPLRIACETLVMDNVRLRRDSLWSGAEPPRAMALVQAQQIVITNCEWDTGQPHPRRPKEAPSTGIAWRLVEPLDPAAGEFSVANTVFRGGGTAIFANDAARRVMAENVLRLGPDPWLDLQISPQARPAAIHMTHVTVRDSTAVIRCQTSAMTPERHLLRVTSTDCVFALKGTTGAVIVLATSESPDPGPDAIVWNGESTLIALEAAVLRWSHPSGDNGSELATDGMSIDGLVAGRLTFVGPPTFSIADSELADTDIPRRSPQPPGVQAAEFGACLGGKPAAEPLTISLDPKTGQ